MLRSLLALLICYLLVLPLFAIDSNAVEVNTGKESIDYFNPTELNNIDRIHRSPFKFGVSTYTGVGYNMNEMLFSDGSFGGFLNSMSWSLNSLDNINYYKLKKPYSSLQYTNGAKKYQSMRIIHSQNFAEDFNISLSYQNSGYLGFYSNQQYRSANFYVSTLFKSRDKRYEMRSCFANDKYNIQENGGLYDLSYFLQAGPDEGDDAVVFNLDEAKSYLKSQFAQIDHRFFLLKRDSFGLGDSLYKPYVSPFLMHRFNYERGIREFIDELPSVLHYSDFYYDSSYTKDSLFYKRFSNDFLLGISREFGTFFLNVSGGLNSEVLFYNQYNLIDSVYSNKGLVFLADYNNEYHFLKGELRSVLHGYNQGDLITKISYTSFGLDSLGERSYTFSGNLSFNRFELPVYMKHYRSNHFIWDNSFNKMTSIQADFSFRDKSTNLMVKIQAKQFKDYVLFGEDFLPLQITSSGSIYSLSLSKKFRVLNFYLDPLFTYSVSNGYGIRTPNVLTQTAFYYQNELIKDKLSFQLGIDVTYFSKFYSNAYSAPLGQFYVQNDVEIGAYPFSTVFANFNLKRSKWFFKYYNSNSGTVLGSLYGAYDYFYLPNNPAPPASFNFGVEWYMFD